MKKYIVIYKGQNPLTELPYETRYDTEQEAIDCARECAQMYDLEQGSQEIIEITIKHISTL